MAELPRNALTRSVRMAALPAAFAGRTALGFGKRVGGKSAELVAAELQARTAEQMFKVLGELKGGAMKLGQASLGPIERHSPNYKMLHLHYLLKLSTRFSPRNLVWNGAQNSWSSQTSLQRPPPSGRYIKQPGMTAAWWL